MPLISLDFLKKQIKFKAEHVYYDIWVVRLDVKELRAKKKEIFRNAITVFSLYFMTNKL